MEYCNRESLVYSSSIVMIVSNYRSMWCFYPINTSNRVQLYRPDREPFVVFVRFLRLQSFEDFFFQHSRIPAVLYFTVIESVDYEGRQ